MDEPGSPAHSKPQDDSNGNQRTRLLSPATIALLFAAGVLCLGVGVMLLSASASTGPATIAPVPTSTVGTAETSSSATGASPPAEVASPSPPPAPVTPQPRVFSAFDADRAMEHIKRLESFGVRQAGSNAEKRGAIYTSEQLSALGYTPKIETFKLPNGKTSRNVIAVAKGSSDRTIVLGAHVDSKSPSLGANDNASGSAALIAMADVLSKTPATATVQFVWFGAEEMIDSNSNHHHFGSRHRVSAMTAAEKRATVGMISVDMIGYGSKFVSRTMERGPRSMDKLLLAQAKLHGPPMSHLLDGGSSGQSDHEAFELAGIPASWIEWRTDPVYHTKKDTSPHVKVAKVKSAGQFVVDVVTGLNEEGLEKLAASK